MKGMAVHAVYKKMYEIEITFVWTLTFHFVYFLVFSYLWTASYSTIPERIMASMPSNPTRPSFNDTEEDLLRFQEEFLAAGHNTATAATVVERRTTSGRDVIHVPLPDSTGEILCNLGFCMLCVVNFSFIHFFPETPSTLKENTIVF